MRKNARLNFRISEVLDQRIDAAIGKVGEQFRDRSEFGTKAVLFYLDYIENIQGEKELILEAILGLAEKVGLETEEIRYLQQLGKHTALIPSVISSNKTPESHPQFDKLLSIHERLDVERQKELTHKMRDATYADIGEIYEQYRAIYMKAGNPIVQKS